MLGVLVLFFGVMPMALGMYAWTVLNQGGPSQSDDPPPPPASPSPRPVRPTGPRHAVDRAQDRASAPRMRTRTPDRRRVF
ncbi:MAG: hypothetical protein AAGG50_18115 [Bacteroidota bacterium]